MSRTVLQVPMSADLRKAAEAQAKEQGFSSLQDAVRVFLNKLASRMIEFGFRETVVLSAKKARRYDKMIEDIEKGRVKTKAFGDVDELMKHLNR